MIEVLTKVLWRTGALSIAGTQSLKSLPKKPLPELLNYSINHSSNIR